jgi:hypothetical protein
MAKADCSELAKNLTQIAMNLASREKDPTIDGLVFQMKEYFPQIQRQDLVDAINEATERQRKQADEATKAMNAIKREAKLDKNLNKAINEFENYLENGEIPKPKEKKSNKIPEAINQLRKTKANLEKWLKTGDPVLGKKLNEQIAELNQKLENGVTEELTRETKFHPVIQELKDEIAALQTKIRLVKTENTLNATIETLQKHLAEGTLPPKKSRNAVEAPEGIRMLKDIVKDLRKEIARSEPARKERLQKALDTINKKIATGNIFPKVKEAQLPQSKELERLEHEINRKKKQIKQTLINYKPMTKADIVAIPGDLMRALLSSGDVSAVLGQGAMRFWAHPIKSIKLFPAMFKSVFSDQTAAKIYQDIMNRPNAPLYFKSKLGLVPWGEAITLSQREEFFRSTLAERIPVLKHIILGSERAYITFLNLLRADAFDSMAGMTRNGQPTIDEAKDIAYHVNAMTGRGNLGKAELATPLLNAAFYSVKYQVSRFQILYEPIRVATSRNMTKEVRKAIAKELARSLAGLATIYFLASLGGGDIEDDPRSVDFGKIRYGKLRIDPTAGLARAIVLLARLGTGEKKTEKGEIIPLRGEDATYGQGLGNEIGGFLRSKLSPAFSTPYDIVTGKHFDGTPVTAESLWKKTVIPLSWGEIETNLQEFGGGKASALAVLSIIGMRMNTYGEPIDTMSRERLLEEIDKNTYKTTGYSERDGEKFYHIKGDPHIGKEDLIDRYRQELGNR